MLARLGKCRDEGEGSSPFGHFSTRSIITQSGTPPKPEKQTEYRANLAKITHEALSLLHIVPPIYISLAKGHILSVFLLQQPPLHERLVNWPEETELTRDSLHNRKTGTTYSAENVSSVAQHVLEDAKASNNAVQLNLSRWSLYDILMTSPISILMEA